MLRAAGQRQILQVGDPASDWLRAQRARWAQVKKDFQEIVLSARQDDFYRRHMYSNFGDAGAAVKSLVDEFQRQTTSSQNINTIEDMQVPCHDLL